MPDFRGGKFLGNDGHGERSILDLLYDTSAMWIRRGACENDPEWKQLIPYISFFYVVPNISWHMMVYNRENKGGEQRLHDLKSVGIGGHINPEDVQGPTGSVIDLNQALINAMHREWREEIKVDNMNYDPINNPIQGLIYDDSNEVGRVHLGLWLGVMCGNVKPCEANDPAIGNPQFMPAHVIWDIKGQMETWSQIVVDTLLSETFSNGKDDIK